MHYAHVDAPKRFTSRQGFTIVELLIVVVVIAILAAITIVSYNGITKSANNSSMMGTLSQASSTLEIYKLNSATGLFPATLSAAGLNLASSGDTMYVYAVSTDSTQYCLASSKAGRTYFISSAAGSPQAGICNNTTGVPGTGNVAVDGVSAASVVDTTVYSIYNGQAPGTTRLVYNDGGGALKVGNRFYTTESAGIKVIGLRVYNPTNADGGDSGFLARTVTAYVYTQDWQGSTIEGPDTFSSGIVATKLYSGARTAGTWTDILFDSPITLPPITIGLGPKDFITLAVQYSGGISYTYVTPVPAANLGFQSVMRAGTYLAENNNLGRGVNTLSGVSLNSYYGIDVLYNAL